MPTVDLDRFKAHGRRFIDGFTPGQKAVTILGVVAVVFAAMMFMRWSGSTNYAALYTDLDPEDAGEVTAELDAQGVAYKLEDGGRTVMVPQKDVYAVRVDLSAQGLPSSGGDSYALLDEGGITKDEFSKRVDYQRALQGELSRTIEEFDGVKAASVTITLPQENVFVGAEEDVAKASVFVDTGNKTLPAETVESIVHLVSSSIADLSPDNVSVTDAAGNVLAAPGETSSLDSSEALAQESVFEDDLATSLEHWIEISLGPGHSAVNVTADLDLSEGKTTTTEFEQPNNIQLPLHQTTASETFTGPPSGATGILGPDGTPLAPGTETPVDYEKNESDSDFALNTIESELNKAPGDIKRLSVSVMLDAESVEAGDLAQWEAALAAAAGIDVARADQLQVTRMPFDEEAGKAVKQQLEAASAQQSKNQLLEMIRYVVTFLIVGLVLFLAWRAIKKAERNRVPLRVPLDLRELEAADLHIEQQMTSIDAGRLAELARLPAEPLPTTVEHEVTDLIERQPDEVAQTLRSWLADRRG